ncbi:alpha-galactosidase-like protein [Melghirimyces profundicolus]|uniref:Alpha-galactosidase-like protein n=1 Tax=Melghirimyces profundicolus TaxID=1242148 RepID=A0A2T6C8J3_9BACL|nr:NEW3 domain-containing protein [Melghirimyces profundicolus]PTX64623.1 alpha-galactosidase-like protein [Melghirimyces profundicolus]
MYRWKKWFPLFLSVSLMVSLLLPSFSVQANEEQDPELWKVLRPLDKVVSFMNTGAHPDDEFSALLAWLSLGEGVRTSSVLANRGEGGQNEIGNELGNGLGTIRTRELQEASKVLGIDLFLLSQRINDPIYDFGFSKSSEETLEKWGEKVVYERLIRRIREQRPDILMPSFRDVPSQHGHHRAITRLSLKAFHDAADPHVFPEHLKQGLRPWQIKKLYLRGMEGHETLRFNIGKKDPVFGLTYPQLGEESRKLHKSQGMGRDLPAEDYFVSLELVKSASGETGKESSLFEGIPVTFEDLAASVKDAGLNKRLISLQKMLEATQKAYPDRPAVTEKVQTALKMTRHIKDAVEKSRLDKKQKEDLAFRLQVKEKQLQAASAVASNITVRMSVEDPVLTRGDDTQVTIDIQNGGTSDLTDLNLQPVVPDGWTASTDPSFGSIASGEQKTVTMNLSAPDDASYFDPYQPSVIRAKLRYRLQGTKVNRTLSVNPVKQTIALLPDWGMQLNPSATIVNTEKASDPKEVTVTVTNYKDSANSGTLRPKLPQGWKAEPAVQPVTFTRPGEQKKLTFRVTAPKGVQSGRHSIDFTAEVGGRRFQSQVQPISYDHIGTSYLLTKSRLPVQAFSLKMAEGLKVGHVDSGFDNVASHLREAGMNVTELKAEDLANGDLSQYDTIVVGIRAYLSREDLLEHNDRLLDYVKNGGHVVMQYHKPWDNWKPELAPHPITPGQPSIQWRVTDEKAPVTFLQPEHPLFHAPNEITEKDFDGWVQERGLYFPSEWDSAYTPLLSMADPGEKPFQGGLLVADYGEGSYIYSSLVWYRQIQNQIPGGYRMFVNLISYPETR